MPLAVMAAAYVGATTGIRGAKFPVADQTPTQMVAKFTMADATKVTVKVIDLGEKQPNQTSWDVAGDVIITKGDQTSRIPEALARQWLVPRTP